MKLLHIGFSNIVSADKVVAIINPDTSSGRRLRESAREAGVLVDCTMGRKSRSMVLTDSSYTFLSCIRPEALLGRMETSRKDEHYVKPEENASPQKVSNK